MAWTRMCGKGLPPEPPWENWFWNGASSFVVDTNSSNNVDSVSPTMAIVDDCVLQYSVSVSIASDTRSHYIQVRPHGTSAWATVASGSGGTSFAGSVNLATYVGQELDIRVSGTNRSSNSSTTYTIGYVRVIKNA